MTVVRNEFEMNENDPMNILQERVMETAYIWHNYGKPTIGCRADIENVDINHLSAFFRKYYQPDNAVLLVAGSFDPDHTLGLINGIFGPIPRPARVLEGTYTVEPTQDGERSVTVRRTGDVQGMMAAYHVPAATDPDTAPLMVLGQVLGDAPSGRLYKAVVETKKAAMVFAGSEPTREPGLFFVGAQVRNDGSLDEARDLILKTTEDPAGFDFTPAEVERAKVGLLKQVDLALNQSDLVGMVLSEYMARGDWRTFFLGRDQLKAVTPADVARVAKTYLKSSNRTLGTFIPTPKPDRAEIPALKDVAAMVKDYKGEAARSQGEAFDVAPAAIEARTVRFQTTGGLKVAVVPKKTRGGSVTATLNLRFGTEAALMNLGAAPGLAGSMLLRGTAHHTRQEVQDAFDRLKANVMVHGSAEGASVSIVTVRENLPEVLKLVTEVLREPSFPASEFETLRQEELASLESQLSEPTALAGLAFARMQNTWPKGHPRYVESLEETVQTLKNAKLDEAKAFHAAFYGASNGELVIVGDVDPKTLGAEVEALVGAWKSPAPYARIVSTFKGVPSRSETLETPDKANAMFLSGLNLAVKDSDPDYPALVLGNFMLGGGFLNSRLATRIRVKDGLSYGVGSQLQAGALDAFGAWTTFAICAPQNVLKVEKAFQEEVERVLASGFTAQEITDAKSGWLQSQEQGRAQDRELAGMIARNTLAGRDLGFQAHLYQQVAALTNDQILAALRKHITPAALCTVKAGDFKKAAETK
jgi:zinc protease